MGDYGFPRMVKVIPEGKRGEAEIKHFEITSLQSMMSAQHGAAGFVEEGQYAKLVVNGKLMMTDTRHERVTNREVVRRAHGKVLIAGLGLGMILTRILKKPEVKSVTIVEKSKDVCELIWPHVRTMERHSDCSIALDCDDIFTWKPNKSDRWNVIYFDIWPDHSEKNLPEIAKLHQKYKYYLDRTDPKCWMGSWEQDTLRSERRR